MPRTQRKVLIVDDNTDYAEGVRENLALYGIEALTAASAADAERIAEASNPEVVFIDIRLGNENGINLLKRLKKLSRNQAFVMITGYGTIDTAIESLKLGAKDYLQKPITFESILQTIYGLFNSSPSNGQGELLVETATSNKMKELIERIEKLAKTDLPVLILGENGTGKEVVADYIVRHSRREASPYVKINSSAFSESLLDNELFGHEKGAYTGAAGSFRGVFERADGGTLFLDEIADMPAAIQSKILRTLQNREIRRIGSEKTITVDVRFIAATNKDLEAMIQAGSFREDLFYRLNAAQVSLPPLRERREDIEALACQILREATNGDAQPEKRIAPEVLEFFHSYSWPGNIRELRNCLLYASAITENKSLIELDDLPGNMQQQENSCHRYTSLEEIERQQIKETLAATGYNKSKAASLLSISRSTLYEKIRRYGLEGHE
jgi:DNA-binding NtrC family response regulator